MHAACSCLTKMSCIHLVFILFSVNAEQKTAPTANGLRQRLYPHTEALSINTARGSQFWHEALRILVVTTWLWMSHELGMSLQSLLVNNSSSVFKSVVFEKSTYPFFFSSSQPWSTLHHLSHQHWYPQSHALLRVLASAGAAASKYVTGGPYVALVFALCLLLLLFFLPAVVTTPLTCFSKYTNSSIHAGGRTHLSCTSSKTTVHLQLP